MTVRPDPQRAHLSGDNPRTPTLLVRWAVGLAGTVLVAVTASYTIFGVAYVVGGSDAISDTLVGLLGAAALLGGLSVSLVAFGLAVVAKVKHEQWSLLWLPLSVFPMLLVVVASVEILWIE
jgi:hypothetical protein